MTTVRDALFDVLRTHRMTSIFANPGSTEVPLLTDLPEDFTFVLALHESSVIGMATGYATATGDAAVALLHTTAGLGNAVGAIATARENRVPLVVIVGQQDRRHLANEPFLTGQLERLCGEYPVFVATPACAEDVPGLIVRARHEAMIRRGPAIVIVPMDDWRSEYTGAGGIAAPSEVLIAAAADESLCATVAARIEAAQNPVLVCGAAADNAQTWDALVTLAQALRCPVWQEPFGGRAGFPHDLPMFAGQLPAKRSDLRAALREHDLVLVVGTSALRQYAYDPGPLFGAGTDIVVVSDDASEVARSAATLAVLTPLPAFCAQLAKLVPPRVWRTPPSRPHLPPAAPAPDGSMRAGDVFAALRERLPVDVVLLEESPSTRQQLEFTVPARSPMGFLSAAMGGLGYAMPAAIGVKLGAPTRPVVAVVGDGSSLYSPQCLWTAQRYGAGVLFVVLSNGGYAIMDRLADDAGGAAPWPSFGEINVSALSAALSCESLRIATYDQLVATLDLIVPGLADRSTPLLLDVAVMR